MHIINLLVLASFGVSDINVMTREQYVNTPKTPAKAVETVADGRRFCFAFRAPVYLICAAFC